MTVLHHTYGVEEDVKALENVVVFLKLKQPPDMSLSTIYEDWKTLPKHEIFLFGHSALIKFLFIFFMFLYSIF